MMINFLNELRLIIKFQLILILKLQTIPLDVPKATLWTLLAKSNVYTPPLKSVMLYVYAKPAYKLFSPNLSFSSKPDSKNFISFLPPVAPAANILD